MISGGDHTCEQYHGGGMYARSWWQRLRGMAYQSRSNITDPLIFENCRSIHTFGMKFDLRVIFLDKDNLVLATRIVRPRRVVWGPRGTRSVVEYPFD